MRFFVIRHGETRWNVEGRFQGQIDTDLNENGLKQAELLAKRLENHSFSAVYSSPLSRALLTARAVAKECRNDNVLIDEMLTEINHGDWEGLLAGDVALNWSHLLAEWHNTPENVRMPGLGGETLLDVQKRSVLAVSSISLKYSGDVAIVSHDAVIKVLLCYWLDAPLSSFWRFQIPNCSITVVEVKKDKAPRLMLLGDSYHIGDGFTRQEQKGL